MAIKFPPKYSKWVQRGKGLGGRRRFEGETFLADNAGSSI